MENKRIHQNKKKIHFFQFKLKKFQKEENENMKNSFHLNQDQEFSESENSIFKEEFEVLQNELKLRELENQPLKESQIQQKKTI